MILLLPSQSAFKFGISEICSGNPPVKLLLLTANVSTVKRIIINNQQPAYTYLVHVIQYSIPVNTYLIGSNGH